MSYAGQRLVSALADRYRIERELGQGGMATVYLAQDLGAERFLREILLESGHTVVADFGIAKAVSALDDGRLTETGMAVGPPAYMTPEQALAEATIEVLADTIVESVQTGGELERRRPCPLKHSSASPRP